MFLENAGTPIAKIWKQPKCPSADEWIKMWYVTEYYSGIKKIIMPFAATWMDLEMITLSGVRKRNTSTI